MARNVAFVVGLQGLHMSQYSSLKKKKRNIVKLFAKRVISQGGQSAVSFKFSVQFKVLIAGL